MDHLHWLYLSLVQAHPKLLSVYLKVWNSLKDENLFNYIVWLNYSSFMNEFTAAVQTSLLCSVWTPYHCIIFIITNLFKIATHLSMMVLSLEHNICKVLCEKFSSSASFFTQLLLTYKKKEQLDCYLDLRSSSKSHHFQKRPQRHWFKNNKLSL